MERIPDSEWLASMVAAAYSEQRYDLGEALARLCGQAYRMERAATDPGPRHTCSTTTTEAGCAACQAEAPKRNEPMHVQDLVRTHEDKRETPRAERVEWCEAPGCNMMIRYSDQEQNWQHINAGGGWVTSPLPAHLGRPPAAETSAPPAEAATLVTPSARCIAILSRFGNGTECHGVLYWSDDADGAPGWVHLEPDQENHIPVANVPRPVTP